MKLYVKYNRYNILATIIVFIVGSALFYFLLQYILIREVDDALRTEQQEIISYRNVHDALPEIVPTHHQYTAYKPANGLQTTRFETVSIDMDNDRDDYRQIIFFIAAGGRYYQVVVSKPLEETEHLLAIIIIITVGMIACILIAGFFVNRVVLSRIWRPFYQTIDNIQKFSLSASAPIKPEITDIDEFALLNERLEQMTRRLQEDYQSLKEFTSHAAHEMQTPLAVIRSKLDMLMQYETVLQDGASNIAAIENAVSRLSRLNQSLLLLAKVENGQFVLGEEVDIAALLNDKIEELTELFADRNVRIVKNIAPCLINFHKQLAEVVVTNLLGNAMRYNMRGGIIEVNLTECDLHVSNTSELPPIPADRVFQKFYRHNNTKEEGNGLGLSIVKQICDMAGYKINYAYQDEKHTFSIRLKP